VGNYFGKSKFNCKGRDREIERKRKRERQRKRKKREKEKEKKREREEKEREFINKQHKQTINIFFFLFFLGYNCCNEIFDQYSHVTFE